MSDKLTIRDVERLAKHSATCEKHGFWDAMISAVALARLLAHVRCLNEAARAVVDLNKAADIYDSLESDGMRAVPTTSDRLAAALTALRDAMLPEETA